MMKKLTNKVIKSFKRTIYKNKVFLIGLIVFLSIFTPAHCASGSMEPTIMTGDICINLNTWFWYTPKRGDIIGFSRNGQIWTKRIIGLPGDMIVIKEGVIYIDGEPLEEDYISDDVYTFSGIHSIYYVPDGHVLVMGDNRENSYDSRYWEEPYVAISDILIKYIGTICNLPFLTDPAPQEQDLTS